MKELTNGWSADVDRGPDWLLVRLHCPENATTQPAATSAGSEGLADDLWSLLKGHLLRRMVLELDEVDHLEGDLADQLVHLHERVRGDGGVLRLCGLSDESRQALKACQCEEHIPLYQDRRDAIMAPRRMCTASTE